MPPSATDIRQQYQGNLISSLKAQVVAAEKSLADQLADAVEEEKRALKIPFSATWWAQGNFLMGELLKKPAWQILVDARVALTKGAGNDGQMSDGAVQAYFELGNFQDRLIMEG